MINTVSLQQISRAGILDSNLKSRDYKLNLIAVSMRIKYENPKLKQSGIANHLGYSSSTLQRYRNDISKVSPYRFQPNNPINEQKRLQILIWTTIHIANLTLRDLI